VVDYGDLECGETSHLSQYTRDEENRSAENSQVTTVLNVASARGHAAKRAGQQFWSYSAATRTT